MKEKNNKRKLALKKAKEKKLLKKALYYDIAEFMVKLHLAQIPQPMHALERFLANGWKGWHKRRGRELMGEFEDELKRLAAGPKHHTMTFYVRRKTYGDPTDVIEHDEPFQHRIRTEFLAKANTLLSRLMELSFDLDFED